MPPSHSLTALCPVISQMWGWMRTGQGISLHCHFTLAFLFHYPRPLLFLLLFYSLHLRSPGYILLLYSFIMLFAVASVRLPVRQSVSQSASSFVCQCHCAPLWLPPGHRLYFAFFATLNTVSVFFFPAHTHTNWSVSWPVCRPTQAWTGLDDTLHNCYIPQRIK